MNTEKKLLSLISSARVMTSTLDLDEVLHQLIKEVLNVIEGANASVLFLYDENIDKLYAKAAVGFDMNFLKHARLAPGEGMSGYTFSAREGQIFLSQADTSAKMANISASTKEAYQKSLGDYKLPTSALSVPLLSKGKCIGVLTVDIYEKSAKFDEQNLKLLETFGAQASIAIENATLFSRNERTTKIHEELSKAAISQGGIGEITRTLAELIDHGVAVYNEFFDVLEASSVETKKDAATLARHISQEQRYSIDKEDVSTLNLLALSPALQAVFFPVKSDSYTIGYLTILLKDTQLLDPLDRFAIEQASIIFALEMTRQERSALNDLKHSGYVLDRLLHAEWNDMSMSEFAKLPAFAKEDRQYVIVQLTINDPLLSIKEAAVQKDQLLRLIYREVFHYRYKSFVFDQHLDTTFLFVMPASLSEHDVYKELEQLFHTLQERALLKYQLSLSVGIGRQVTALQAIRTSHRDAKKCIDYVQTNVNASSIISYHQLGIQRLFLNTEWSELEGFVEDTVGPLLAYDKEHETDLFQTLTAYLETSYNTAQTAKVLFVHPNTVKYRLKVIINLLNLPSLRGKEAFELQLGIYIYHYMQGN